MVIKDWPSADRPREKLLEHGAESLTDAELLAIFLRTGIKGKTAVDLARDLLNDFGGLREILIAPKHQFCAHCGLGNAKYAQLQAVVEMAKRHLAAEIKKGTKISSAETTKEYLNAKLRDKEHEVFAALFLDSQHQLIAYKELFKGSLDSASVYPREVIKEALNLGAGAVIFAHNHPSGIAEPSNADIAITERLCNALKLIDIRVLDHFIVGHQHTLSFSQKGLI